MQSISSDFRQNSPIKKREKKKKKKKWGERKRGRHTGGEGKKDGA